MHRCVLTLQCLEMAYFGILRFLSKGQERRVQNKGTVDNFGLPVVYHRLNFSE